MSLFLLSVTSCGSNDKNYWFYVENTSCVQVRSTRFKKNKPQKHSIVMNIVACARCVLGVCLVVCHCVLSVYIVCCHTMSDEHWALGGQLDTGKIGGIILDIVVSICFWKSSKILVFVLCVSSGFFVVSSLVCVKRVPGVSLVPKNRF
jgi:hypothetical protein